MNETCFYIAIILDRSDKGAIAYPKIIESVLIERGDIYCILQHTKTNAHRIKIRSDRVFASAEEAKKHLNDPSIAKDCESAVEWYNKKATS